MMPITELQLEMVRALVANEPDLGRPALAKALGMSEHVVRQALRELGHRAAAGRKRAPPPSKFRPSAWPDDLTKFLVVLGNNLNMRANREHGLSAEEVAELRDELQRRVADAPGR